MILGLVLARGGSKRIPRKNVRLLGDSPLICWTLSEAAHARNLSSLVVSSEDEEILDLSSRFVTTIKRPAILAGDKVPPYPAIIHALDVLDEPFTHVCLLQPTSPFRTADDIDTAICFCRNRIAVASFETGAEVPNGAVYVGRTDWLRRGGNFDEPDVFPYYMPTSRSLDIDTEEDWAKAEEML